MQKDTRNLLLIVDDVEMNRDILRDMLEEKYEIIEAEDGAEALSKIAEYKDSLCAMLLDLIMPKVSGLDVIKKMYADKLNEQIPIIVISSESDADVQSQCYALGVYDFVQKPFDEKLVELRLKNATDRSRYRHELELTVESQIEELQQQNRKLEEMNESIISLMAGIVEARDSDSGQHVNRVKTFTNLLAVKVMENLPEYGLTEDDVRVITSASALHDVGKIMISDTVLLKPGRFTPEEFELMKKHCEKGCEVLMKSPKDWDEKYMKTAMDICNCHHEKWDGKGYPRGLKGDEIPISAQIVSIADCYDALTQRRVYKDAFSPDKAYEMIAGGECGAFSEKLLFCFEKCRDGFKQVVFDESLR